MTRDLYVYAEKMIARKHGRLGFFWRPYYSSRVAIRRAFRHDG